MLLNHDEIEERHKAGDIVIYPFDARNLKSAQYDVSMGEHCYREQHREGETYYNPFDERHVRGKWQLDKAIRHGDLVDDGRLSRPFQNIGLDEYIILVKPGELILAHTEEFIGGRSNDITTVMKARSSSGRNFFEICRCAGMGDHGYFNRWTMEIANTSRFHTIPLVWKRRVAQILFLKTNPIKLKDSYEQTGKYQSSSDLNELIRNWSPESMLPKQWKDRECEPYLECPIASLLFCCYCGFQHIDEGEWATRLHSTHLCKNCKKVFSVDGKYRVGVKEVQS